MTSFKVWYLLGILLLGSLQIAQAQTNFSAEDASTENSSSGAENNDSNEEDSNGLDAKPLFSNAKPLFRNPMDQKLLEAAKLAPMRAHQAGPKPTRPRFESEEDDENDYDPVRDNFFDRNEDGTYAYGYSLPHGVRRYERSFYSDNYKGLVVEGFYTQARQFGQRLAYELRCYRSDAYGGYRPLPVQYLSRPPVVERNGELDVTCFDN